MADFLKSLPSFDETNFSRFQSDLSTKKSSTTNKTSVYISTDDQPTYQVITTEKTNILLRYLHQQWNKKNALKKRDPEHAQLDTSDTPPARKVARTDPVTTTSNS